MFLLVNKVDAMFHLDFGDQSPCQGRIEAISSLFGKDIQQTNAWFEAARFIVQHHDIKFPKTANEPFDYAKLFRQFRPYSHTRIQANEDNGAALTCFDKKDKGMKKSLILFVD